METAFTNELGNRIRIGIQDGPDLEDVPQVTVTMEGPTSVIENIITRQEAIMLAQTLNAFLNIKTA